MPYYRAVKGKAYPPSRALRSFVCHHQDCGMKPDAPMIKDEIWYSISDKRGLLCIAHVEERLGRQLTVDDLLDCAGNAFTFLMHDRMTNV